MIFKDLIRILNKLFLVMFVTNFKTTEPTCTTLFISKSVSGYEPKPFNPLHTVIKYRPKANFNAVLCSHLRLCLPNEYIPSGFSTKLLYTFLVSLI
jgi:hypothetical protein